MWQRTDVLLASTTIAGTFGELAERGVVQTRLEHSWLEYSEVEQGSTADPSVIRWNWYVLNGLHCD
jgi:hypothetical protein